MTPITQCPLDHAVTTVRDLDATHDVLQQGGFSPARLGERILIAASETMICTIAFSG